MFYNYKERMDELKRIANITYPADKKKALLKFIEDEKKILQDMSNPLLRSQALDSAIIKLNTLKTLELDSNVDQQITP